jgi:phage terminase large subunit-like protein
VNDSSSVARSDQRGGGPGPRSLTKSARPDDSLPAVPAIGRPGGSPTCARCGAELSGRQRRWCSARCRVAATRTTRTRTRAVLGRREPTYRLTPDKVTGSRGQEAVDLATSAGLRLDEWQQDVLVDGMALNGHGWAADEVVAVLPRQNGKTIDVVIRALWGPTLGGEKLVLFTAHEFKTCREAFLLAKSVCETEVFARFEPKVSISHGKEGISFASGNRLLFIARSRTSGRGFSPDCVILDEAFELDDLVLAALKPSLAAAKTPQMWFASSAPHETSTVLRRLCLKGRTGEASRMAYLEWCAPPDLAAADVRAWEASNPALGDRIDLAFVASELDALQREDFERERLGRWDETASLGVFPEWDSLADPNPPVPTAVRALGIDVTPDRRRACIAAAADLGSERVLVEVIAEREGVSWVVDEVAALVAQHKPDAVVVDLAGQGRSLIPPLEKAGVQVKTTDLQGMVAACAGLSEAVHERRLVHRGDPILTAAVEGARQRQVGDGAWAWARRTSRSNVAPLVAATLATWGVKNGPTKFWVL